MKVTTAGKFLQWTEMIQPFHAAAAVRLRTCGEFDSSLVGVVADNGELGKFGFFHSNDRFLSPVHDDVGYSVAI